jgi:hypothetical protein
MTKGIKSLIKDIMKPDEPSDFSVVIGPKTYAQLFEDLNVHNGKTEIKIVARKMPPGKKVKIV